MKSVKVRLGTRTYGVQIGPNAVYEVGKWVSELPGNQAFIIADEKLRESREKLRSTLRATHWKIHEIPVRAGEELKEFPALYPLYGRLVQAKADRNSVIIALGGGSIGDATGFLASTYLRGVAWAGVPTTLLAQVDSSIGGKTGINYFGKKNLIGSFHQPSLVACDTDFLKTLPKREIISGLGEVIKYSFIFDEPFFRFIKKSLPSLLSLQSDSVTSAIYRSLKWKAKVVSQDEFDKKGFREALNFGHTFGHALESATSHQTYHHGEAVIWGMRFALALSLVRKKLSQAKRSEMDHFLAQLTIPPLPSRKTLQLVWKGMLHDKKIRDGKLQFVLLRDIGKSFSDSGISQTELDRALRLLIKPSRAT